MDLHYSWLSCQENLSPSSQLHNTNGYSFWEVQKYLVMVIGPQCWRFMWINSNQRCEESHITTNFHVRAIFQQQTKNRQPNRFLLTFGIKSFSLIQFSRTYINRMHWLLQCFLLLFSDSCIQNAYKVDSQLETSLRQGIVRGRSILHFPLFPPKLSITCMIPKMMKNSNLQMKMMAIDKEHKHLAEFKSVFALNMILGMHQINACQNQLSSWTTLIM